MNQSPFIIPVVLAGLFYAAGQYIAAEPARSLDHVLTVQATGKSSSVPTLATIMLGVQVPVQPTAEEATNMMAKQINAVLEAVRGLGIEDKDIKTQNLSVQPSYDYSDGKQTLKGYEASQQVQVTVRDTGTIGKVVAKAAEVGANQIGGVSFQNEEPQSGVAAAEKDAIANATKKAQDLAAALGVKLGKVKNYSMQPGYTGPLPYALEAKAGRGGDGVVPPDVPVGTQEDSVSVTITYEIK